MAKDCLRFGLPKISNIVSSRRRFILLQGNTHLFIQKCNPNYLINLYCKKDHIYHSNKSYQKIQRSPKHQVLLFKKENHIHLKHKKRICLKNSKQNKLQKEAARNSLLKMDLEWNH